MEPVRRFDLIRTDSIRAWERAHHVDSLSQLIVGAAVGEAVLGTRVGRKALAWGAVLGTLPDLDVLIPLDGPVARFVQHRGFSHSLLLLAVLAPLFAGLITRIHPATRRLYARWWLLAFLVLEISVVLDLLTVYGTRVLWPLDTTPRAWPVFFIVDPLFTLPLAAGTLAALLMTRRSLRGHRLNAVGLALAVMYTLWAFGVREVVDHRVRNRLDRQHVAHSRLLVTPAPFNTLLWRVVGLDGERYFETYYSVFDGRAPLSVRSYPRRLELLQGLEDHRPVVELRRFTRGWYALSQTGGAVVMTDLRMGSEPTYVFRFKVGTMVDGTVRPSADVQLNADFSWRQLAWVWRRIRRPLPTLDQGTCL